MSESIEIEYKTLLTEQAYLTLIAKYQLAPTFFQQTNVYYDTADYQLSQNKMGLRIRLLETEAEVTLKSPLQAGHGLLETTDPLTLTQAKALVSQGLLPDTGAVKDKLTALNLATTSFHIHGELTTKRAEKQLTPDILLVLDESWYHGCHDYELEMEVSDPHSGQAFFQRFLATHMIPYQPAKNKIKRTLEAKSSI